MTVVAAIALWVWGAIALLAGDWAFGLGCLAFAGILTARIVFGPALPPVTLPRQTRNGRSDIYR